jgi:flagellar biosynthesis/type III secretory pathway protein FliH
VAASAIPTEPIAEFLARDVRLFRAALAEALDVLAGELAARLAAEVLGRELLLAPADLAAIAARLLTEHAADEPLRLRVAPGQAQAVESILPVIEDSYLASGDAVLECRGGSVDARLTVRLATLVAWLAP